MDTCMDLHYLQNEPYQKLLHEQIKIESKSIKKSRVAMQAHIQLQADDDLT